METTLENFILGMSKRTSYGKNYHPDVSLRPRLSRGCGFTHRRVFTIRGRSKNRVCGTWRIRAGAGPRGPTPARTWHGRANIGPRGRG
jgi:hypothetical protein